MSLRAEVVADVLVRRGLLSAEQAAEVKVEAAVQARPRRDRRRRDQRADAYDVILRLNFPNAAAPDQALSEVDIAQALALEAGLEHVRIDTLDLDADLIESKISRPFAMRHRMLPLAIRAGKLRVACADPFDVEGIEDLRRIAKRELELVVASEPEILKALTEYYGLRHSVTRAEREITGGIDLGNLEQLVRMKSESEIESSDQHIINAVEYMLQHAYDTRASDIHIEPKRESALIRFRIDGVLHDIQQMPMVVHRAVVNRIKTMARLDIAEKRRPQDGRVKTARNEREIELRISTLPVAFGEKVVMRIFDPDLLMQDLPALGFFQDELVKFNEFISRPHGMVLVTGPTGAGKTTTLYSALKAISSQEQNITTIEDPIEMVYEPFNQTAVNVKAGVTFAVALRHILRQDPDIIMVGEIRDTETAQLAVQAALTGHLMFSTMHTNDASTAITRLADLGIEPFLVSSTLVGSMAQRLVRKICAHCTIDRSLTREETATLRLTVPEDKTLKVKEGEGCLECRGTGFFGRTGIFEVLSVDEPIKELVMKNASAARVKQDAVGRGMRTLRQSALHKLANGITTFEEVLRVTGLF